MQQSRGRSAAPQRHAEGVERQLSRDARAHRPADDAARAQVEDHRQVEPAFPGRNVRDVGHPHRIAGGRRELARQHVGRDGEGMPGVRRDPIPPPPASRQAPVAHQARHALATPAPPARPQLRVDARAAVPLPTLPVNRRDLDRELRVAAGAACHGPRLGRVEPGARHRQAAAQHGHRKGGLLRGDERESHAFSLGEEGRRFPKTLHRGLPALSRRRRG
jgi:hypothetical protein